MTLEELDEIETQFRNAAHRALGAGFQAKGSDWQSYLVSDGNLITGQNPASSELVAKAVLAQIG